MGPTPHLTLLFITIVINSTIYCKRAAFDVTSYLLTFPISQINPQFWKTH